MNVAKSHRNVKHQKKKKKEKRDGTFRGLSVLTMFAVLTVMILAVSKVSVISKNRQVYAASEEQPASSRNEDTAEMKSTLPTGIAGVVTGVNEAPSAGSRLKRIGTSCENVMVGQRIKTVEKRDMAINVSDDMENTVNNLDSRAEEMASTPKMMSDTDYDTLLRIVEAEAGTEDIKGRVLIANVIMNRVRSEGFPNNITDVVWEYDNGVPQFSPTYDGTINTVTVSDETREAVKQAMEGVDYSEGALFFIQKSAAEKHNVEWFEKDLKKLFKYGCHEFYTYPEMTNGNSDKQNKTEDNRKNDNEDSTTVQVVKN